MQRSRRKQVSVVANVLHSHWLRLAWFLVDMLINLSCWNANFNFSFMPVFSRFILFTRCLIFLIWRIPLFLFLESIIYRRSKVLSLLSLIWMLYWNSVVRLGSRHSWILVALCFFDFLEDYFEILGILGELGFDLGVECWLMGWVRFSLLISLIKLRLSSLW